MMLQLLPIGLKRLSVPCRDGICQFHPTLTPTGQADDFKKTIVGATAQGTNGGKGRVDIASVLDRSSKLQVFAGGGKHGEDLVGEGGGEDADDGVATVTGHLRGGVGWMGLMR
jgi:hypothetical protein